MTNYEHLCQSLRDIGRAEAAQILESRTTDEWRRLRGNWQVLMEPFSTRYTASALIDISMSWIKTSEGNQYWSNLHHALLRHERGDLTRHWET